MSVKRKIMWLILIMVFGLDGCSYMRHDIPAGKSLFTDLPEEIYVYPKVNTFRDCRVGVFCFNEPFYAAGTGKAAAEAVFYSLLKKRVFAYVSNMSSETSKGMAHNIDMAQARGYDLIIVGDVIYYMDGSDHMQSHVKERISVVHVQTGRLLWSAMLNSSSFPAFSKDCYLFQTRGGPAQPTSTLMRKNASKFSNMLINCPTQTGSGGKQNHLLLSYHRSAFEGLQKERDGLFAEKERLEEVLSKEVDRGKGLEEEVDVLSLQADQLEEQLKEEIKRGEVTLKRFKSKTIINIDNSICFDSGSAVLKKGVRKSLKKVLKALKNFPDNKIQIEGHTDNVPIRSRRYRSNWELSSSRALSVLRFFLDSSEIAPEKLSAAGYGEYHPIVPNDSEKNKRLNRRVDIVIVPG